MTKKLKFVGLYVPSTLWLRLRKLALERGMPMYQLTVQLIERGLRDIDRHRRNDNRRNK